MPNNARRPRRVALVVLALAVLGAVAALLVTGCGDDDTADLPEGVVARVGDAPITRAELDRVIARNRKQAEAQGQSLPSRGDEGFQQVEQQALQSLVQQRIIDFEARRCGTPCKVTEKDITEELARIRKTNFENSQKQFDDFLKQQGISTRDARALIKQDLQRTKLEAHVTRGVRFTEADARAYYKEHPDEFKVSAGRTARHILVETEAEAKRIRAGLTLDNFADMARRHSTDTGSAQQGGELGAFQKGTFVPEFEKVALRLKDGEISQPVKTQFGWHIITVETTPARTVSFEDAKGQILTGQLAQKRQQEFTEWSQKVLKEWDERTVYADDGLRPPEPETSTTQQTP